jgi:hypothetical protein
MFSVGKHTHSQKLGTVAANGERNMTEFNKNANSDDKRSQK